MTGLARTEAQLVPVTLGTPLTTAPKDYLKVRRAVLLPTLPGRLHPRWVVLNAGPLTALVQSLWAVVSVRRGVVAVSERFVSSAAVVVRNVMAPPSR